MMAAETTKAMSIIILMRANGIPRIRSRKNIRNTIDETTSAKRQRTLAIEFLPGIPETHDISCIKCLLQHLKTILSNIIRKSLSPTSAITTAKMGEIQKTQDQYNLTWLGTPHLF
jgi:hypothetical protein